MWELLTTRRKPSQSEVEFLCRRHGISPRFWPLGCINSARTENNQNSSKRRSEYRFRSRTIRVGRGANDKRLIYASLWQRCRVAMRRRCPTHRWCYGATSNAGIDGAQPIRFERNGAVLTYVQSLTFDDSNHHYEASTACPSWWCIGQTSSEFRIYSGHVAVK